jgi:hypothetical protein
LLPGRGKRITIRQQVENKEDDRLGRRRRRAESYFIQHERKWPTSDRVVLKFEKLRAEYAKIYR